MQPSAKSAATKTTWAKPAQPATVAKPSHVRQLAARIFQILVVLLVLFTTLFPLYWLVTLSVKVPTEALTTPPVWFPSVISFESYRAVMVDQRFYRYFLNGLLIASTSALISLALGSAAAYGLNARFRGSETLALAILAVRMIPPIILAIPLFLIMRNYGMLDTYRGLILVYIAFSLPFSTWMMRGFLLEVPAEIEDAAQIDGHTRLGAFVRVILPLTGPGLAATGIFCFLLAWNEFLFALILTRTDHTHTMPIAAASYMTDQYIQWDRMAATGVISIVPVVILMMAVQRYLVRGLTFGAVKG